jgi:hypothetical protein
MMDIPIYHYSHSPKLKTYTIMALKTTVGRERGGVFKCLWPWHCPSEAVGFSEGRRPRILI